MDKNVVELFAGVGGFRLGLERLQSGWNTVWFSQWEPNKKQQWAHDCYVRHFGTCLDLEHQDTTNTDITKVDKSLIPDCTLLTAGFPCQSYSVANALAFAKGLEGEKGQLWWQICDVIRAKHPAFCLFENVDRLLKSPASQRGRDFAIMLSCLATLGYSVQWRVVNAADYGAAQKRRRVFIFAYRNDTAYAKSMQDVEAGEMLLHCGLMAQAFPVTSVSAISEIQLPSDMEVISNTFTANFRPAGYMTQNRIMTADVVPDAIPYTPLKDILEPETDGSYDIEEAQLPQWEYYRSSKHIARTAKNGHQYTYSEGAMAFPDPTDKPGRTILTSEGQKGRTTHVVEDLHTGHYRILTPVEVERLQGFDDNWTDTGMPQRMRYFCMGNALVTTMITRMGKILDEIIAQETSF